MNAADEKNEFSKVSAQNHKLIRGARRLFHIIASSCNHHTLNSCTHLLSLLLRSSNTRRILRATGRQAVGKC
jgi:hypothetical protein